MKKIMLSTLAVLGFMLTANANTLTVYNYTPCFYGISTQGGYLFINPGATNVVFTSAASNPYTSAKVMDGATSPSGPWAGQQVNVGPGASSGTSAAGVACNSGNPFTVFWSPNGLGNITMMIN
ncbi:hypothetical protein DBR32_11455 [Taibaiella sp. KBW10]|uniref:hypothetical protein n=1 Tax=Taibaiella sp. KBW10 TaxID=2153357 RepID=UPI000F58FE6B|nr:hypothetical protein [Taibaiella sp. KBW10]RQO30190.1 hypothetical protein DBR32_11455 [Taibaiella sp. KBW10]